MKLSQMLSLKQQRILLLVLHALSVLASQAMAENVYKNIDTEQLKKEIRYVRLNRSPNSAGILLKDNKILSKAE